MGTVIDMCLEINHPVILSMMMAKGIFRTPTFDHRRLQQSEVDLNDKKEI